MSEPEYEITEQDVETMLGYLRLTLPDQATPEKSRLSFRALQYSL
jgi:hypothetical protein